MTSLLLIALVATVGLRKPTAPMDLDYMDTDNAQSKKTPANNSKMIFHLRSIHFALIITSLALATAIFFTNSDSLSKAIDDLKTVKKFSKNISQSTQDYISNNKNHLKYTTILGNEFISQLHNYANEGIKLDWDNNQSDLPKQKPIRSFVDSAFATQETNRINNRWLINQFCTERYNQWLKINNQKLKDTLLEFSKYTQGGLLNTKISLRKTTSQRNKSSKAKRAKARLRTKQGKSASPAAAKSKQAKSKTTQYHSILTYAAKPLPYEFPHVINHYPDFFGRYYQLIKNTTFSQGSSFVCQKAHDPSITETFSGNGGGGSLSDKTTKSKQIRAIVLNNSQRSGINFESRKPETIEQAMNVWDQMGDIRLYIFDKIYANNAIVIEATPSKSSQNVGLHSADAVEYKIKYKRSVNVFTSTDSAKNKQGSNYQHTGVFSMVSIPPRQMQSILGSYPSGDQSGYYIYFRTYSILKTNSKTDKDSYKVTPDLHTFIPVSTRQVNFDLRKMILAKTAGTQKTRIAYKLALKKQVPGTIIQSKNFRNQFPDLYHYIRKHGQYDLSLDSLEKDLFVRLKDLNRTLTLFGATIPADYLSIVGIVIIFAILTYFIVHLRALLQRITSADKGFEIPWMGVYPQTSAFALTIITTALMPILIVGGILFKELLFYNSELQFDNSFYSALAILILLAALSIMTCRLVLQLRKRVIQYQDILLNTPAKISHDLDQATFNAQQVHDQNTTIQIPPGIFAHETIESKNKVRENRRS